MPNKLEPSQIFWTSFKICDSTYKQNLIYAFTQEIIQTEVEFDFNEFASQFKLCPELTNQGNNYPSLSASAKYYFNKLDTLYRKNPLIALKILTISMCQINYAIYKPDLLINHAYEKLKCWFSDDYLPQKIRVEWGIYCWKNWPISRGKYDKNIFIELLIPLFNSIAEKDPDYVLSLYDSLKKHRSSHSHIFEQFEEGVEDFLKFAYIFKNKRPELLIGGLRRLLWDGRKNFGGYSPGKDRLCMAASELFSILMRSIETQSPIDAQKVCQDLILYAYPDQLWYAELFPLLWEIETKKTTTDEQSLRNFFLIILNCRNNNFLVQKAVSCFHQWASSYQNFNIEEAEANVVSEHRQWLDVSFVTHATNIKNIISWALYPECSPTRNLAFEIPSTCQIVNDATNVFWQMVAWLSEKSPKLYMFVLAEGLRGSNFPTEETKALSEQAELMFLRDFDAYAKTNVADCIALITYMISCSSYTQRHESLIRPVLDIVYPIFDDIDHEATKEVSKRVSKLAGSFTFFWYPKLKQ